MCLGRAGGSGGAFARSESIGSGWRTFGHWSNNSSWFPAAARRPPQSDMWKRVPQAPHCLARSEFPRESEPPHLWHVPRAAFLSHQVGARHRDQWGAREGSRA